MRGDARTPRRYVAALVRADIELLSLTPQAPLEALFFMLTETSPDRTCRHRAPPSRGGAR